MIPRLVCISDEKKREEYIDSMCALFHIPLVAIYRFSPEKKEFSIAQIRTIQSLIAPSTATGRLIILFEFQTASVEAQNALLKALEEYSDRNCFLLMVRHPDDVLPTIQSRCMVIPDTLRTVEIKQMSNIDASIIPLYHLSTNLMTAEEAKNMITKSIEIVRSMLDQFPALSTWVKKAIQIGHLINKNNINPQLAIDTLTIQLRNIVASEKKTI